jgi:4'-phosphopantetheinyl transferase
VPVLAVTLGLATCPPLGRGDVHVWRARLATDPAAEADLCGLLSEEERQRAERFRRSDDRLRFQVGRGLLRALLGRYGDLDPCALPIVAGPHGKPALPAAHPGSDIAFNVSHSGTAVLVALARGRRVGIDVERLCQDVHVESTARRFFSLPEIARLEASPEAARAALFLRTWVMKEAFAKGLGLGIGAMELQAFAVNPEAADGPRIEAVRPSAHERIQGWFLQPVPVDGPYAAALAAEGAPAALRLLDWPAVRV